MDLCLPAASVEPGDYKEQPTPSLPSLCKSIQSPSLALGTHCLTAAVVSDVSAESDSELACSFEMFTVFLKARDTLVPKLIWGR